MHVEPPEHAPKSLKDFFIQYLMIVVGILTALGLEQILESVHHHHLAEQASHQIEDELRSNLEQVSGTLAQNRKRLAELKAAQTAILKEALQKTVDSDAVMAQFNSVHIGAATPSLRRDAWDASIANQALSYVDAAEVRRYSEGYSAQTEQSQTILVTFTLGNWPAQLTAARVDAKLGRVDPANLLKALAAYDMALAAIAENERELEEALNSALNITASAAAPKPPTSH